MSNINSVIQRIRDLLATNSETAFQKPERSSKPFLSTTFSSIPKNLGTNGQNAFLPNIAKKAGKKVSADSTANTIPLAATGPRPLFELRSENIRQSNPKITVKPDANMGSKDLFQANAIASNLDS